MGLPTCGQGVAADPRQDTCREIVGTEPRGEPRRLEDGFSLPFGMRRFESNSKQYLRGGPATEVGLGVSLSQPHGDELVALRRSAQEVLRISSMPQSLRISIQPDEDLSKISGL